MANGFGQEFKRAGLHRANRHRYISAAANEDNGQLNICFGKVIEEVQPALPRQSDIKNEASEAARFGLSQKFPNCAESLDSQADRLQKTLKRFANLGIVVDDGDGRLSLFVPSVHSRS